MKKLFTRRGFCRLAGAASVLLSNSSRAQDTPNRGALRVRLNVTGPGAGPILASYSKAVDAMQALPATDPRNWRKQAEIHLNHCPHGNWFFLPWHRAYLRYFEEICRDLSGDPEFVLPYWNWTKDPQVPKPFWNGVLNDSTRTIGPTDAMLSEFVGQDVIDIIMKITGFEQFASFRSTKTRGGQGGGQATLEARPHNHVHGRINGDMGNFLSPRDPIYWLHHANIDRLWAMWNLRNGNTEDGAWKGYNDPAYFADANKNSKGFVVAEVLSTYQLGYRYDTQPPQSPPALIAPVFKILPTFTLSANTFFQAQVNSPASVSLPAELGFLAKAKEIASLPDEQRLKTRVLLNFKLRPPTNIGTFVRVFLNCDYLNPETPLNDPHYVGSIAFFGNHDAEHNHGEMSYVLDITDTLSALKRAEAFPTEKINPQLLVVAPQGATGSAAEVGAAAVDITIVQAE